MARILLVDDDADIRRIVKKILETKGHSVMILDNGLTALDELNANIYDLLISDASMPHFSGFDLIRSIRRQKRHKKLAIAMLTGRREKEDIEQAIELKVDDYIVKPIDPSVLLEKVDKLLSKNHSQKIIVEKQALAIDAVLQNPIHVTEMHADGFTATSLLPFNIGAEIHFSCKELNQVGVDIHKVKITGCQTKSGTDNTYVIYGQFLEMTKSTKEHLEEYLQNKDQKAA